MNEVCVDANVAVKPALKGEAFRAKARRFIKDGAASGVVMIAPPIFESELDSIIRKRVFEGQLTPPTRRSPNYAAVNFGRRTRCFTTR